MPASTAKRSTEHFRYFGLGEGRRHNLPTFSPAMGDVLTMRDRQFSRSKMGEHGRKAKLGNALNALESARVTGDEQDREQARIKALEEVREVYESLDIESPCGR